MKCAKLKDRMASFDDLDTFSNILSSDEKDHLKECELCQQHLRQFARADRLLHEMQAVSPPEEISKDFLVGIHQRLDRGGRMTADYSRGLIWPRFRIAIAGLTILIVVFSVWRLSSLPEATVTGDYPTSDSIEYYLESYDEVSSANPIYVVKEMEYDWTGYEIAVAQD